MQVIKRDGKRQDVSFDKVAMRIKSLCAANNQLNLPALTGVNCDLVARKIISQINDGISTSELDTIGAAIVQPMLLEHPHYGDLASRLLVSNHHKNCNQLLMGHFERLDENLFYWTCRALWENIDMNGNHAPMIAPHIMRYVEANSEKLESLLQYGRDYKFTYQGFELASGSYLLQASMRVGGEYQARQLEDGGKDLHRYPIERPQHMWLRVALGIWLTYPKVHYRNQYETATDHTNFWDNMLKTSDNVVDSFDKITSTYELLSNMQAMHATPTLFHSGMLTPQLSSCFLTTIKDDSLESIADYFKGLMMTSKWAGGIGSHLHHIRPEGSYIAGTGGTSNGLVPLLKCANEIAKYVDQGGSKRPGSHAVYLEMWHGDIEDFVDIRRQRGNLAKKAPALFNALWICDEFMRAVEEEERRIRAGEKDVRLWYLMDPSRARGLPDKYDQELRLDWISDNDLDPERFAFTCLYRKYIKQGWYMRRVSATALWKQVCEVTEETSIPYILFKDACNRKSNQKNVGTICSSNLCVAPETKILTNRGYHEIQKLVDKDIKVWNGTCFSKAIVAKTSDAAELIKIRFSNGMELECTEQHKFHIQKSYNKNDTEIIEAKDLQSGMKLIKYNLPKMEGLKNDFKYPYTHGFFCGDGYYQNNLAERTQCEYKALPQSNYCKRHHYMEDGSYCSPDICQAFTGHVPCIWLYEPKYCVINHIEYRNATKQDNRYNIQLHGDIAEKFNVPTNQTIGIKMLWLAGYADADGTIAKNGNNLSLQIGSTRKEFLQEILLMLHTMGIDSKICLANPERDAMLPDGMDGKKLYHCKAVYRLLVNSNNLYNLINLGFSPKRLNLVGFSFPNRDATQFIYVEDVIYTGRIDETYCFNEPIKHLGMFNGVLAGNCTEILEYSDGKETAVCNLASICLNQYVVYSKPEDADLYPFKEGFTINTDLSPDQADRLGLPTHAWFNFKHLMDVVKKLVINLDRVIDQNYYPTEEEQRSNMRHRPIGLGVQGLADCFAMLWVPFDSEMALQLDFYIFEHIDFASKEASIDLAGKQGSYQTFAGSPASQGKFQVDLWLDEYNESDQKTKIPDWDPLPYNVSCDWERLSKDVQITGLRNSLTLAPMPTASTSTLTGCSPAFEPFNAILYKHNDKYGEAFICNRQLQDTLIIRGLWTKDVRDALMKSRTGSIQDITTIPRAIRDIFKNAWDMSVKVLINHVLRRGVFVDQSQSFNWFVETPSAQIITQGTFYGWKRGIKTGRYYLRRLPPMDAKKIQLTNNPIGLAEKTSNSNKDEPTQEGDGEICTMKDGCIVCSS
jgi:ribonucleoside-diphosphate reductase alpha chain